MAELAELEHGPLWYDARRAGTPLVLLHGGFVDASSFDELAPELAGHFRLYLPEQRGHGDTPDHDGPITFDAMATDTIAFLERVVGGPAYVVGHSDGGIVALIVALRRPDLVRTLIPVSTIFHHDATIGLDFTVEQLQGFFGDRYAATSPDGAAHFPVFAERMLRMWCEEPTMQASDLTAIATPTLVIAADDDAMTREHTVAL